MMLHVLKYQIFSQALSLYKNKPAKLFLCLINGKIICMPKSFIILFIYLFYILL